SIGATRSPRFRATQVSATPPKLGARPRPCSWRCRNLTASRLLDLDATHVSFRWKDYRENGRQRSKVMRLDVGEFMRRFLLHVLPTGFHRIRHYGLFANGHRADKLELCRRALNVPSPRTAHANSDNSGATSSDHEPPPCPCCGGRMIVIETFDG